jgi:hypothetical protein
VETIVQKPDINVRVLEAPHFRLHNVAGQHQSS